MAYRIELSGEFCTWYELLNNSEQVALTKAITLLQETQSWMLSSTGNGIQDPGSVNIRELRTHYEGCTYRVLYVFTLILISQ
jgi:hypothetical protein